MGTSPRTEKANLILKYASDTKKSLADQCDASRKARRPGGGALTHAEQDLLRAMVVFAGAGLDSCLKQLVRDTLGALASSDPAVQRELETFVVRSLRSGALGGQAESTGREFLARILVAAKPQMQVAEEYIRDLTGESLQSPDQLFRVVKALGIGPEVVKLDSGRLKEVFEARNQIIHEMDIQLSSKSSKARKRRSRTTEEMGAMADDLLGIGGLIVSAVDAKLSS